MKTLKPTSTLKKFYKFTLPHVSLTSPIQTDIISAEKVRQSGFVGDTLLRKLFPVIFLIFIAAGVNAQNVNVSGANTGNGSYATLTSAFNAINGGVQLGTFITISIAGNTNEPSTGAVLNEGAWNALMIQPLGFRTVSGLINPGRPLIDLNGADRVTIDGAFGLTFSNTTTSSFTNTSTIRLTADASNNLITRCIILGSSTTDLGISGGTVLFGNGITTGNDNNTISFCDIGPAGVSLSSKGIQFAGISGFDNNTNAVRNCNIYDYFSATLGSAGIHIRDGSTNTEIRDNRFYQRAARTQTTGAPHFGICVSSPLGNNHLISGNVIGFSSSAGTGTYSFSGVANSFFLGILVDVGASTATSIQGNTVAGISMSGSQSGNFDAARFIGINVLNGLVNIGNTTANTIGSLSSTGSISYTSSSASASAVIGISLGGTANITASNNNIGGITASNSASGPANICGIRSKTTGALICQNNLIGGTVANSIQSTSTSTSTIVTGIENSGGSSTISNNTIRNITSASGTTAGGYTSPVSGIMVNVLNYNQTISRNIIHTINNTDTSSATTIVSGIYFAATSTTNLVERNFIHSLNAASVAGKTNGIYANGGTVDYQNNMIRLGIDASGNSVAKCLINGVDETGGSNNFYFNSVYIGGTAASGSSNTFAFNSTVTTNTRRYIDNIFSNERSNSGGTGKHYAISAGGASPLPAGLISNYNILYVNGTGTVLGLYNSVDRANLSAWKTATGKDTNSISANPVFVNPTGNSSAVNLHINGIMTPVEGAGVSITSVTNDYDGQTRSSFSPTDIGADADNFYNLSAPVISYTPLPHAGLGAQNFNNVIITDSSGINGSPGTRPRCYYKKTTNTNTFNNNTNSTNGWKYVEAAGSVSPFNFTINNSLVSGGVAIGDTIQYFVVAQDLASTPNVGINSGILASSPASVDLTAAAFPVTGAIRTYLILPVTVSGALTGNGAYSNLAEAFSSINSAAQTGADITILIQRNTTEPATGCQLNSGSWNTLTIKPDGGAARTVSGSMNAGIPLIRLYGADRVKIDGLNSAGNSLTLSNTSTSSTAGTSTIMLDSGATDNVITRCTISGSSQTYYPTVGGTIMFNKNSSAPVSNNNSISSCNIGPAGSNLPTTAIYIEGTAANTHVQDTIRNCNIFNYYSTTSSSAGIYVAGGTGSITVKDNKFYQTATRNLSSGSYNHSAISIQNGGDNFVITGNTIGYSSSSGTGTYTINATSQLSFYPIHIANVGTSVPTNIQGNTIANISLITSAPNTPFAAIYASGGLVNIGNTTGNTIGNMTAGASIVVTINATTPVSTYGIYCSGSGSMIVSSNNIGGFAAKKNLADEFFFDVINNSTSAATWTCQNNIIGGSTTGSIQATNSDNAGVRFNGISSSNVSVPAITNNTIRNLRALNAGSAAPFVTAVSGISITSSSSGNVISQNTIHSLDISGSSTAANTVNGINSNSTGTSTVEKNFLHSYSAPVIQTTLNGILAGSGTVTYKNNFIRLGIRNSGSSVDTGCSINGIFETGGTNNFYFNSVYIGGSPDSGSLNTFAFQSSVTSNTRMYYDNIFFNARSNDGSTGKHYSIAFGGTTPNPAGLSCNYNILYANGSGSVLGLFNGVDRSSLADWRSATAKDSNSLFADPQFINPTGDTASVNLHIGTSPTIAESRGLAIVSVNDDFDGEVRSSLTPTDIGADAGDYTSPDDIFAPSINYSPLAGDFNISMKSFTAVSITDSSGVSVSPGLRPRCYYKRSTDANTFIDNTSASGGWKYAEANGSASPFDFTIDYSRLNGSVSSGSVIEYFVVAQDMSVLQNVGINSGTFAAIPVSVNLLSNSFPISGTINSYAIGPIVVSGALSGNGAYTTLTSAINAVNGGAQTNANISITINGNTTEPAAGMTLNQGNWSSLKIFPQGGVHRIISRAITAGSALIRLNGADNVTIDGLNSGGDSLTLSNTTVSYNAGTSTIQFSNDASNNVITRCKVLGSSENSDVSAISNTGNIYFASGTVTGNDDNLISYCDLGPAGSNNPSSCLTSIGSSDPSAFNTGDTIRNCNIYNYHNIARGHTGIYLGSGSSDFDILNNRLFQTSLITQISSYQHSAIWINNTSGNNFKVLGNIIGYSSSNETGKYSYSSSSGSFKAISLSVGSTTPTSVQGNMIKEISISGTMSGDAVTCIFVDAGITEIGNNTGNIIGSMTDTASIFYASTSSQNVGAVTGIYNRNGGSWTTNNNSIGGLSVTNPNSNAACQVFGINSASTGTWTCSNNIIGGNVSNSLRSHTTANRTQVQGLLMSSGTSQVSGNIIRNLTTAAQSTISSYTAVAGIMCKGTGNHTLSENVIYGLNNTNLSQSCDVMGIYVSTTGTNEISRNLIHSLSALSPSARIFGTHATAGTNFLQNNMIRLGLDTSGNNMSTGCAIAGMHDFGGTNNYYFNSVYIGGGAPGQATSAFKILGGPSSAITLLNNIFYNERTSSSHYAINVNGSTAPTSNNNILYAPQGSAAFFNGGNQQAVWNWTYATGQDANSFGVDPQFINRAGSASTFDLHISNVPTPAEQKGAFIASVAEDFDGDLRVSFTPTDIGADAGNFSATIPMAGDYTIGLSLFNSISGTNISFQRTAKKGKNETEINDSHLNNSDSGEVERETFVPMQSGEIYTGPLSVLRSDNPDLPGDAMSGVYATISAAINDIAASGVSAPVRFLLLDNSYTTESFPLPVNSWTGVSSLNTVTLKPSAGVSPTISGNNSVSLFDINGGEYFIIDGSNLIGGDSKNLTISNSNFQGPSIRFINDARNNTVKNCLLNANSYSSQYGSVYFSGTTGNLGNDSNLIQNNDIYNSGNLGIYNSGTGTTSDMKNSGNKIIRNRIFGFSDLGISDDGNSAGTLYEGNEIFTQTGGGTVIGFRVASTTIDGFIFSNNYIHDIGGIDVSCAIELSHIKPGSLGKILNNFIAMNDSYTDELRGIHDLSGTGENFDIYFNSIFLDGNIGFGFFFTSYCFIRSGSGNLNFKNNILVNSRTGGYGPHYVILANSPISTFVSDYNDLFNTGGGNTFGILDGNWMPNLGAWRSASGKDSNSVSGDPKFVNAGNLHIDTTQTSPVGNAGTPIAGITTDYDKDTRNLTSPDIGADEYGLASTPANLDLTMFIEGFYNSGSNLQVSDTITVYLKNSTSPYANVDSARTVVGVNGSCSPTFSNASSGSYYIVPKHRNSIETWSSSAIAMTQGSTVSYDFTTSAAQAFGSNMKQVDSSPSKYAVFGGDINQDGSIDLTDIINVFNDANGFLSGYVITDVTGDDFVDLSDVTLTFNNANAFVVAITP